MKKVKNLTKINMKLGYIEEYSEIRKNKMKPFEKKGKHKKKIVFFNEEEPYDYYYKDLNTND